jgi:hypothetical protein
MCGVMPERWPDEVVVVVAQADATTARLTRQRRSMRYFSWLEVGGERMVWRPGGPVQPEKGLRPLRELLKDRP